MGIELVTRRGCHLCEEVEAALRAAGIDPQLRDVDADADLFRLYDFRVPVVLRAGRVVAEGRIDADRLRRALDRDEA
jgi:predicted thioredoxin/glutaredoxin